MSKELTTAEKLKNLYALQAIDSEIDKIAILKGELPMEVQDLEDEIAGLAKRVENFQAAVKELEGEEAKHENNIATSNKLIERYEQQLNNVKNNREYDALNKEIELQKLEIQLSNKRIREAKQNKDAKTMTLEATKERHAAKQEELARKKVELEEIIAKTEKEEVKLKKQSEKARKHIEARLLKAYDRIRNQYRNGLAVVNVERDACGGCFNKIPPQLQLEIRQRKQINACEHCGRVLVDDYIMDVGTEKEVIEA